MTSSSRLPAPAPDQHITVLLHEAVAACLTDPAGIYIDGTFGRGGHSRLLLSQLAPEGRLLGIDKDPRALAAAQQLAEEDARFSCQQGSFAQLPEYLAARGWSAGVQGILVDLGVSSPQIDDPERGFSLCRMARWICVWIPRKAKARQIGWRRPAKPKSLMCFFIMEKNVTQDGWPVHC